MSLRLNKIFSFFVVTSLAIMTYAVITSDSGAQASQGVTLLKDSAMLFGTSSAESLNWAGYAAVSSTGSVSNVTGSFVVPDPPSSSQTQPAANQNDALATFSHQGGQRPVSSSTTSYAAFWAGIDGFNDNTVEQAGVLMQVTGSTVNYSAWYEFYPAAPVYAPWNPGPGDNIAVYVNYSSTSGSFTAAVVDLTYNYKFVSPATAVTGADRSSAEWIAEAPSSARNILPLADFGTVYFGLEYTGVPSTNYATVNDHFYPIETLAGLGGVTVYSITMVNRNGSFKAAPSGLSTDGTSFSVTWYSS